MKKISANKFQLDQFERIEDIVYLDEPILTHLRYNKQNYFQYLVDSTKKSDIYLIFEVEELTLYHYLTGLISLWQIIKNHQDFFFRIEEDFHGKVLELDVLTQDQLDPNYFPSEDSYIEYQPTQESYYYSFLEKLKTQSYLLMLRKKAFYLKIEPNNKKYGDTIGFMELSNRLLQNISSSYGSFLEADFKYCFKSKITDEKKLQKSFKRLKSELDYRMVDVNFGSFEIGLAVDEIMKKNIGNSDFFEWSVKVGKKYKNLVLDRDYDENTVHEIVEQYEPKQRKKIFEPIFSITEDPNFTLSKREPEEKEFRPIRVKEKSVIERIVSIPVLYDALEEKKELKVVKITTVIDSKHSKKSIRLDENTLFDALDSSDHVLHQKDFLRYGFQLDQEIEVPLQISTEGETITFSAVYEGIDFKVTSNKMEEGMKKIISKIFEFILDHE